MLHNESESPSRARFKYCPYCGAEINPNHRFCGSCGQTMSEGGDEPVRENEAIVADIQLATKNATIQEIGQCELELSILEVSFKRQEQKFLDAKQQVTDFERAMVVTFIVGVVGPLLGLYLVLLGAVLILALFIVIWVFRMNAQTNERNRLFFIERDVGATREKMETLRAKLAAD